MVRLFFFSATIALGCGGVVPSTAAAETYHADPSNYQKLLKHLQPGDTLQLPPGIYENRKDPTGLRLFEIHGTAEAPIVITGPESGPPAILIGKAGHNTVRLANASYVTIRHLEIDGRDLGGEGIKAEGVAHHITLENLFIHGVGGHQSIVGIATTGGTAWNWIIRQCVIDGAGTAMYLGSSDGSRPFIAGLIEHNLITNSIGYNVQIKHQRGRPSLQGIPTHSSKTIIRHNVFSKGANSSKGRHARPNLLVGHYPLSGPGQKDVYEIYGNFFYENPSGESLFQGEGNIALYHNVFFNSTRDAVSIHPHNDFPRMVRVFQNTVIARRRGIEITGGDPQFRQLAFGNIVFSDLPIRAENQAENVTGWFEEATDTLVNPFGKLGELDFYPRIRLKEHIKNKQMLSLERFTDAQLDFNGNPVTRTMVGAYAGWGVNPGWLPQLERKPFVPNSVDPVAPADFALH